MGVLKKILGVVLLLLGLLWLLVQILFQFVRLQGPASGASGLSVLDLTAWQNDPAGMFGVLLGFLVLLAIGALLVWLGLRLLRGPRRRREVAGGDRTAPTRHHR